MRQWAQSELDNTPSGRPSGKRRSRIGGSMSLQELSANNLQLLVHSPGDEDAPPVRLSRHIPQREGMDMAVSAYNLTTNNNITTGTTTTTTTIGSIITNITGGGVGGGGGAGISHPISAATSYSSVFSESFVSDDSSYVTSIYNEVLAEQLSNESTQRHRKIGGEILRFDSTDTIHNRRGSLKPGVTTSNGNCSERTRIGSASSGVVTASSSRGDSGRKHCERNSGINLERATLSSRFASSPIGSGMLLKRLNPCKNVPQRVLFTNPERVLDAPEFPVDATQLLHWGSNNKLIIGLNNSLYGWDSETSQASKIVQLQDNMNIHAVHWLHKCTCVALALEEGTTAIYDCRNEEFLRTVRVRLPPQSQLTQLAVNGPLLAIGTSTAAGGVYVFDLRAKQALISCYEGHNSSITSLNYCTQEPFYLASGTADGSIRVWDARRSSCPRYAFAPVHRGAVSAIMWDPDKRSKMYTGGHDGMLCYVDTHAPMRNILNNIRGEEEGGMTSGANFITRAIHTLHPITGIVAPSGVGEVATAHRGKGHIQLRHTGKFQLIGTFNSPNCEAGISCLTMAPDMERICAAQDETLKFWRVFGPKKPLQRTKSATPPPVSLLDEELR